MKFRRQAVFLGALLLALTLTGLPGTAQGQAVKNPDTLVVMDIGGPETLDPSHANDIASWGVILWNVYETLIFFNGGRTDQYVPMLATEVPSLKNGGISSDGKTYTFKIRQGVQFHDGSTMTTDDVKYSLLRLMLIEPPGGRAGILLSAILGSEVQSTRDDQGKLIPDIWDRANRAIQVKGNNLVINLKDPYAPFLAILAVGSVVVSKTFVVQHEWWNGTNATLARFNNPQKAEELTLFARGSGTGPFRLEHWDRATETVTLVRNESYWRAPAKLQRIVIKKVEEFGPRRLALQNGDADIITVTRPDQPAVTGLQGVRIVDDLPRLFTGPALFMNLNINPEGNADIGSGRLDGNGIPPSFFADINIRRAFAHLFDRNRFLQEALRGKGRVANGPVPFGVLGYHPKGKWYDASREKAIAAFREAHGGQVWERGFKFTVAFLSGNVAAQIGAQMVKEAAEAVNPRFNIEARSVTLSAYLGQVRSRKLPMFFLGWTGLPDPHDFMLAFMSSRGFYANGQSFKNAEADKLVAAAAKEPNQKKREQLYFQLQDIAFREVPTIYLVYQTRFVVMRSWVKGWYHNPIFFTNPGYDYAYRLSKG